MISLSNKVWVWLTISIIVVSLTLVLLKNITSLEVMEMGLQAEHRDQMFGNIWCMLFQAKVISF